MGNRWNEATTLKFVQLYREQENLWNVFDKDYRNRELRAASMKAIVDEMNVENFTTKDVPKKIKALRSTYHLELGKVKKSKASGGGTDFIYKPSVTWFNDMDHIMKTANTKESGTSSNLEFDTQAEMEIQVDEPSVQLIAEEVGEDLTEHSQREYPVNTPACGQTLLPPRTRTKGQKRRLEAISDAVRELKGLNEKMESYATTTTSGVPEDECDIMGKHIAIQLRQLPTDERLRANFEIQRILMDFRLRNISHTRPSTASTSSSNSANAIIDISSNPCSPEVIEKDEVTSGILINSDAIKKAMTECDPDDNTIIILSANIQDE